MDDEFCKQRAKAVRELAEKADPFIKKRLLELARHYERRASMRPASAVLGSICNFLVVSV